MPWIGDDTNWIAAKSVPKMPTQCAATTVSPWTKNSTRCGSTGMISPNAQDVDQDGDENEGERGTARGRGRTGPRELTD
jgi:hypothetical protein